MFWIKATARLVNARRHPDEVTREVESELRFHIEMRTRANVEQGMKPDNARRAALQSFGDFEQVKNDCCEIRRSLPFDSIPVRMVLHIAIATVAGFIALWAVNVPHDNFTGVARQLILIAVLSYLFIVVRRPSSKRRYDQAHESEVVTAFSEPFRANQSVTNDRPDARAIITAYDEQGRTPLERMFKS